MKYILIALGIIAISILSCDLERSNPLDPDNNSKIDVPSTISISKISSSSAGSTTKWVKIEWNKSEDVDRYLVYRALDYDGTYSSIVPDGIPNTSDSTTYYFKDNNVYAGNLYWYRLAGMSEEGLIGHLSSPQSADVE